MPIQSSSQPASNNNKMRKLSKLTHAKQQQQMFYSIQPSHCVTVLILIVLTHSLDAIQCVCVCESAFAQRHGSCVALSTSKNIYFSN